MLSPNTYTKLVKNPFNKLSRNGIIRNYLKNGKMKITSQNQLTKNWLVKFYQEHTHYRKYIKRRYRLEL